VATIGTIGKNYGDYQIERNMVIVKKKTHGKKKGRRTPNRNQEKNETERCKIKLRKHFFHKTKNTTAHTILLTKVRDKFKNNYLDLKKKGIG
jgi:hypothetical protein